LCKTEIFDAIEVEDYGAFDANSNPKVASIARTQVQERRRELEDVSKKVPSMHPGLRVTADVQTGNLAVSAIR